MDDTLDGRTKEGRAVRHYLAENNLDYNTTKHAKGGGTMKDTLPNNRCVYDYLNHKNTRVNSTIVHVCF